jgi:hypothetical protein
MALYDYALIHLMYGRYHLALDVLLRLTKRKTDWSDIEFGVGKALAKCYKGLKESDKYLDSCIDLINRHSRSKPILTSAIFQDIAKFNSDENAEEKLIVISSQVFQVGIAPTSSTSELFIELENPLSVD